MTKKIKNKDDDYAKLHGYQSSESMRLCTEYMDKHGLIMAIDRHNFIKGWQAHEKILREQNNG